MSRKYTVVRILIVVGVLYSALLVVMIIFFAMSINALSGVRLSYENPFGQTQNDDATTPTETPEEEPMSLPVSY